jgi:DNA gyrase/topoisomerase IV subunit A
MSDVVVEDAPTVGTEVDGGEVATLRSGGADSEPDDGGFRPITSQEALDNLLKSRLERANKAAEKKFQKTVEELTAKISSYEEAQLSAEEKKDKRLTELESQLEEATDRYTKLERARTVESLARDMGLPEKFWSRVQGSTDDEIISDINDMLEGLPKADKQSGIPSQAPKVSVSATGSEPEVEVSPKSIVDKMSSMFDF